MVSHSVLGAINAKQNKVNPILGVVQALALEGVAHTPFANSLPGGAAVAAGYGIFTADLAQIDAGLTDWFASLNEAAGHMGEGMLV